MKTFADAEARLAESLPGYESRPQQQELARAVEALLANPANHSAPTDKALIEPVHLVAQAGCGTGKSLAYLIPAILSGRRTIVSVTTKALQDQLAGKDLPFLEEHLGVTFSWSVLKGRTNYFCARKAEGADEVDVPMLGDLLRIADEHREDEDFDGTREAFGIEMTNSQWMKVCSDSDECKANDCYDHRDESGVCFATDARLRAQRSTVVIVNHSLFFTDLVIKHRFHSEGMLGEYESVVFDEAHEIEEIAGNTLGTQFSEGSFASLTTELRNFGRRHADDDIALENTIPGLIAAAQRLFTNVPNGRLREAEMNTHAFDFGEVFDALRAVGMALADITIENSSDYSKAKKTKERLLRRTRSIYTRYAEAITASFDDLVRWVEEETSGRGEKRKVLKVAPITVSDFLRDTVYSGYFDEDGRPVQPVACVLVSATLAVKGKMDYIAGRLGIDRLDALDVGTPFDFATQARIYVPTDLPEPSPRNNEMWETQANQRIVELIKASDGRALVLFTSVKHMRAAFASVQMQIGNRFQIKMQGQQGETNKSLAAWFDQENHGVLFGTKSFFTGVDFQGETLSLVIVAKMPFPVPTEPMVEARCEAIDRNGGSSFADYTIPVMSLVLQQAVGRLIRHREDTGVVAILDPRLMTKGYGNKILGDLPPMTPVMQMDQVQDFFGPSSRPEPAPVLVDL